MPPVLVLSLVVSNRVFTRGESIREVKTIPTACDDAQCGVYQRKPGLWVCRCEAPKPEKNNAQHL
jgi:hypothetical protein